MLNYVLSVCAFCIGGQGLVGYLLQLTDLVIYGKYNSIQFNGRHLAKLLEKLELFQTCTSVKLKWLERPMLLLLSLVIIWRAIFFQVGSIVAYISDFCVHEL